ncbi:hypothetical protein [Campylobacter helveticus]|nr:hypothetical protein [Campylobacter helveticus]
MKKELKIRPEARLIKTIGEDLIKNPYAAVVELIKALSQQTVDF